jgi:hypothetical protein
MMDELKSKHFEMAGRPMELEGAGLSEPESLTTEELAYIAGFFDGEGSITIHENWRPSPRGKSPNHTLQVSIGNTDPQILAWIHAVFGGSLTIRPSTKPRHREVTQWIIRSNGASTFLRAVLAFLRMKKEQALIGISFQDERGGYRSRQLTDDEIAFRESKRVAIRLLNGRNVA